MKKLLFIFLLYTGHSFAQTYFQLGPEMGYAYGGKGTDRVTSNELQDQILMNSRNNDSWLVGFRGEMIFRRFFYFSAAIQYQTKGSNYTDNRFQNGSAYRTPSIYHRAEDNHFKKICVPLTLGLTMKVRRSHPAIFVGWRPNFIVQGKHSATTTIQELGPAAADHHADYRFNPLRESPLGLMRGQKCWGVSIDLFNGFMFLFTVNKGSIHYTDGTKGYGASNNDYLFTVTKFCRKRGFNMCKLYRDRFLTVRFL